MADLITLSKNDIEDMGSVYVAEVHNGVVKQAEIWRARIDELMEQLEKRDAYIAEHVVSNWKQEEEDTC